MPLFNSPASLSIVSHPHGEVALAQGLASRGSTIIILTLASYSVDEITRGLPKRHPIFFRLYVSPHLGLNELLLSEAIAAGARGIIITVDLPVMSKREANERYEIKVASRQALALSPSSGSQNEDALGQEQARSAANAIDANLSWEDIAWIREKSCGLPVLVKGIQCAEDALLAPKCGCAGIYISKHGGRGIDTSQPSILTLAEIKLNYPEVLEKMLVLIDGGIRRGIDILKAFCLGANAVCLGRSFFYGLVYGEDGVKHAIDSESSLPDPSTPSMDSNLTSLNV